MATYSVQQMSAAGTNASYTAVSSSDTTGDISTGRCFLHVKNAGGSADTVTIVTPGTVGPALAIADLTVSVPNGADRFIGPLDPAIFGAVATVNHSFTTSVTAALIAI